MSDSRRDPGEPYASNGAGGVWLSIAIPAVPHPSLSPNRPVDPRTKARHRKALKEAAYLATHNATIAYPWIAESFGHGRLTLIYTVFWPNGRSYWDGDNLLAALKGATDGVAQKLRVDDAEFDFLPVHQHRDVVWPKGCISLVVHERALTATPGHSPGEEDDHT